MHWRFGRAADGLYEREPRDSTGLIDKLIAGLDLLRSKREELPKRKHGNVPL